jgi:glycosyltransferase involved in cell wall biosynthesis
VAVSLIIGGDGVIDIIIPTLGRPHKLAGIVANLEAVTVNPYRLLFAIEGKDTETYEAAAALGVGVVVNERTKNYSGALNTAYELTDNPWLFTGADDLVWDQWWDRTCLATVDNWFQVVGTNDLLNAHVLAGWHSTHSLVSRGYLDTVGGVADIGPGSFYPECYDHNYCDTEFVNTAKMRGRWRPCLDAVVEHGHVTSGKAEPDETYLRSIRHYDDDDRLYEMRMSVWSGISR